MGSTGHGLLVLSLCAALQEAVAPPADPRDAAMAEASRRSVEFRRRLTDWYARLDAAEAAGREFLEPDPTPAYVRELTARAEAYRGGDGALLFQALIVQSTNDHARRLAVAREAIQEHGESPFLTPLVAAIRWSVDSATRAALMDAILAVNQHPRVRAEALLTRAGRWLPSRRRPDVPEEEIALGVADLREALAEARRLADDDPPVWTRLPVAPDEDLVATLEGKLFQVERLRIGLVAPDIQGQDLDGVEFRLSDYRGKVVVLDFWGHW